MDLFSTINIVRHRHLAVVGIVIVSVALFFAQAAVVQALTVVDTARKLARDTERLGSARKELASVEKQRSKVSTEQRRMHKSIEARLVTIYKTGGSMSSVAEAALSGTLEDLGSSLEALEVLKDNERRALIRWERLLEKERVLNSKRRELNTVIKRSERAVAKSRALLNEARAKEEAARAEAARMSQIKDSPLLPRVGHPETAVLSTVTAPAAGSASDANRGAKSLPAVQRSTPSSQPIGFSQSGVASYYGDDFAGQATANGERYNPNAFTAAHPSLPFGTWVTVSGPSGSVAVRINDRGPFIGGRIIDLSEAAANAIGVNGVANVTLSVAA